MTNDVMPEGYLSLREFVQKCAEDWFNDQLEASVLSFGDNRRVDGWQDIRRQRRTNRLRPEEYSAEDRKILNLKAQRSSRAIWISEAWERIRRALYEGSISGVVRDEQSGELISIPSDAWHEDSTDDIELLETVQFRTIKGRIRGYPIISIIDLDRLLGRTAQTDEAMNTCDTTPSRPHEGAGSPSSVLPQKRRGSVKSDLVKAFILAKYPDGMPESFPVNDILRDLKDVRKVEVSESTLKRVIRRLRTSEVK